MTAQPTKSEVLELLQRDLSPDSYREIRELWKAHSIAEDRRDIDGLLATLTPDCVYVLVPTGDIWRGHDGARRFYLDLLTAIPDITFTLTNIVIGPQGVFEEADVTGTLRGDWLRFRASGQPLAFKVLIVFPWDPRARRFSGERVFFDEGRLLKSVGAPASA